MEVTFKPLCSLRGCFDPAPVILSMNDIKHEDKGILTHVSQGLAHSKCIMSAECECLLHKKPAMPSSLGILYTYF